MKRSRTYPFHRHFCTAFLLCLLCLGARAQQVNFPALPNDSSVTHRFVAIDAGLGRALYRDRATSPLFFSGEALHAGLGMHWLAPRYQLVVEVDALAANLLAETPQSNYFQSGTAAQLFSTRLQALYLRRLPFGKNSKMDYLLGGGLQAGINFRNTPAFFNNGFGFEGFAQLLLAGEVARDISRREAKTVNLWFVKLKLKPNEQRLSMRFTAGILNANFRPGYAFSNLPEIDGRNIPFSRQVEDYSLSWNGWYMGSRVAYTRYTARGNGHRLSYIWDAMHMPGRFEPFDMASHRIAYTLLFNTQ